MYSIKELNEKISRYIIDKYDDVGTLFNVDFCKEKFPNVKKSLCYIFNNEIF